MKVHFVCLEGYGSLLQISPNKIMKYAWVPSSTKKKQTPATVARAPRHHHCHLMCRSEHEQHKQVHLMMYGLVRSMMVSSSNLR